MYPPPGEKLNKAFIIDKNRPTIRQTRGTARCLQSNTNWFCRGALANWDLSYLGLKQDIINIGQFHGPSGKQQKSRLSWLINRSGHRMKIYFLYFHLQFTFPHTFHSCSAPKWNYSLGVNHKNCPRPKPRK